MKVTPDDEIWRAKLVFIGPPGYTLPWQYTYGQYALFAGAFFPLEVLGLIIFGTFKVTGPVIALTVLITAMVSRVADFDLPARKVLKIWATDWRTARTPHGETKRLTASHITVRQTITGKDEEPR